MERKQKISLGGGLFLGLYAGIAVFLLAILSVDFFRDDNVIFYGKNWLNGFLTFPTVLVGAITAFAAFRAASSQIQHNIDMEEERRQERLAASLALLPVVLLNINQMGIQILRRIAYGAEYADQNAPTSISQEDIAIIRGVIGSSRGDARTDLQNLLAIYQIALHLFQEFSEDEYGVFECSNEQKNENNQGNEDKIDKHKIDNGRYKSVIIIWVVFLARASHLLEYGRNGTYQRSSGRLCTVIHGYLNGINGLIDLRLGRKESRSPEPKIPAIQNKKLLNMIKEDIKSLNASEEPIFHYQEFDVDWSDEFKKQAEGAATAH